MRSEATYLNAARRFNVPHITIYPQMNAKKSWPGHKRSLNYKEECIPIEVLETFANRGALLTKNLEGAVTVMASRMPAVRQEKV